MGTNGIQALAPLNKRLVESGIRLRFLCLAEPKEEERKAAIQLCNACINHPPMEANKLSEALLRLDGARSEDSYPVLIYDATPTTFHHSNLIAVLQRQDNSLFYLGEKPIFTDPFEKKHLILNTGEDFEFFCELIETESPVFLSVKEYLTAHSDLKITNIWSWRAGCSGIKKAILIGRLGVEGGALEDKSLHDFSISVGLLGRPQIKEAEVSNAEIHSLILHRDYYFNDGERVFLTVGNHATSEILVDLRKEDKIPADGLLSMEVLWKLEDRDVPAKYLFSWIGFNELEQEAEFVNLMEKLGFPLNPISANLADSEEIPRRWLDTSKPFEYVGDVEKYTAKMQEIRVGVFRCEEDGKEKYIVCNFLSKYNLRRYAYVVEMTDGRPIITETLFVDEQDSSTYEYKKKEDLARVLHNVIKHAFRESVAEYIDRQTTLLIHDVMIRARKQAFEKLSTDVPHWFSIAERIFHANITRTPL